MKAEKTMAQINKERKKKIDELVTIMLNRANLKPKDIYEIAVKRWATKNLDLLTPAELKKYNDVIYNGQN